MQHHFLYDKSTTAYLVSSDVYDTESGLLATWMLVEESARYIGSLHNIISLGITRCRTT